MNKTSLSRKHIPTANDGQEIETTENDQLNAFGCQEINSLFVRINYQNASKFIETKTLYNFNRYIQQR